MAATKTPVAFGEFFMKLARRKVKSCKFAAASEVVCEATRQLKD